MNRTRKVFALTSAASLLTVPVIAFGATSASADTDRTVSCGGGVHELSADREDGRFEVDAEVDRAKPGSLWRVQLSHDGKTYYDKTRAADREGEIEVETLRANTSGNDVFRLKVTRVYNGVTCGSSITLR